MVGEVCGEVGDTLAYDVTKSLEENGAIVLHVGFDGVYDEAWVVHYVAPAE